MDIRPIRDALPSEHVIDIQPAIAPQITDTWRQRLKLFTGRSLSATALASEQQNQAGQLATLGQQVSPGVVKGLEVILDDATTVSAAILTVTAGHGITALGEDVIISVNQQVRWLDLPVVAPATDSESESSSDLSPRSIQGRLADLIRTGDAATLPAVAILIMQPVVAEIRSELNPTDPCEEDPQNYAFEDWQQVDGARLLLYSFPEDWQTLPTLPESPSVSQVNRWRSQIAYTVFTREATLRVGETLPWSEWGVPIALVGFGAPPELTTNPVENSWFPLFADGYAVVRQGGQAKHRHQLQALAAIQQPLLWQARIQQFAEQLAEMSPISTPEDGADRRLGFAQLPPIGILPNAALDLTARRIPFFPIAYDVRIKAMPTEQLDAMMVASAGLAPLALNRSEQVQVLLPVPQRLYEPNLLDFNTNVAQEFLEQIESFRQRRAGSLQRQQDLRQKLQALYSGIYGNDLDFTAADANIIDPNETPATGLLDPPEDNYGTERQQGLQVAVPLEELKTRLREIPPLRREVNRYLERDSEDFEGLEGFIKTLEAKVKRANDPIDFGFLRVRSDLYRVRQFMLGAEESSRLVTSPVLAELVKQEESAFLTQQNLSRIFDQLRQDTDTDIEIAARSRTEARTVTGAIDDGLLAGAAFKVPLSINLFSQGLIDTAQKQQGITPTAAAVVEPLLVESRIGNGLDNLQVLDNQTDQIASTLSIGQISRPAARFFRGKTQVIPQEAVVEQLPLLGAVTRSATVGERLKPGAALDSLNFAVEGQIQTVQLLALQSDDDNDSIINVDDLEIPGTRSSPNAAGLTFGRLSDAIASLQKQKLMETEQARDDARLYERGIKSLEDTVATLRLIEGRVQQYRQAIADSRRVLKQLKSFLSQADARLKTIDDELAEARHDVAFAETLREEEESRLQALVEHRQQILRNHVPFLVFHRPRSLTPRISMPHHGVSPGETEPAVPVCLRSHPTLPDELRQAVNLFQDAPIKWFKYVIPLLNRFDRLPLLTNALRLAQSRAQQPFSLVAAPAVSPSHLGQAINRTMLAQTQIVNRFRQQTAQFQLSTLTNLSWHRSRNRARDLLALGDLLNGRHLRSDVARQVNREIDLITQVSGCLYTSFSDVLPQIRLQWAEQLSQYDQPINLQQLVSLPRWNQIPYLERRQMQELVDWLYNRINRQEADAIAMMHDLVRICILLASHAPVNQIIAGRVSKPTTLRPGGRVELTIAPNQVRIGMPVFLYGVNNQVVAEGRVEDLSAGQAAASITSTRQPVVQIEENARVHFGSRYLRGSR